ncbi:MAG: isopentenyl phosphate kinase family protein [Anaerolineae bacterium]|nr:isopentenyl phosphate kinase family protein [Anaerolineae bacterium]
MEQCALSELVFCKLGGSVLTDKQRTATPRQSTIARLSCEIAAARATRPNLQLVLGHGSGSFGHSAAHRYGVRTGIADGGDWWGYAETGAMAARLNRIIADALLQAGVPVVSVQPSASARCRDGALLWMAHDAIEHALQHGLVPMVYGDVAFDETQGCTIISTEDEFAYLAEQLKPERIVLVGEVDGVYDRDPISDTRARQIPLITPASFPEVETLLGGSHGIDVTGGMLSKVRTMVRLVACGHTLRVDMVSGRVPGQLQQALTTADAPSGTVIAPA